MNTNRMRIFSALIIVLVIASPAVSDVERQALHSQTSETIADIKDVLNSGNTAEIENTHAYLTGLIDSAFHMNIRYIGSDIQSGDYCFTGYFKSEFVAGYQVYKLNKTDSLNLALEIIKGSKSPYVSAAMEIESRLHSMFPCTKSTSDITHKAGDKYIVSTSSSFVDTARVMIEGGENTLEYSTAVSYVSGIMEYAFVSEKGKRYLCWDLYFQSKDQGYLLKDASLALARELINSRLEHNRDADMKLSTAAVLLSEFTRRYSCTKVKNLFTND